MSGDELPEGWRWVRIGDLADVVKYGSSAKTYEDSDGVPVLRMGNIFDGQRKWTRKFGPLVKVV